MIIHITKIKVADTEGKKKYEKKKKSLAWA
jgi:hypothetical protein